MSFVDDVCHLGVFYISFIRVSARVVATRSEGVAAPKRPVVGQLIAAAAVRTENEKV